MIVDVELTAETYGPDCIARLPDGRTLFVPFGVVGETVKVEIVEEKKNYARGKIVKVLQPAAARIDPRCPHFGDCGGCHYQHLPYAAQLALKQRIVTQQLQRIGKIEAPPVMEIVPSPLEWNYRNAVQFHLSAEGKAGYERMGSNRVVQVSECHLPLVAINSLWPRVEIDAESGIGRFSVRAGAGDDLLLAFEGATAPEFEIDFPLSVVFLGEEGSTLLSGEDYTLHSILGRDFHVTAGAFFQVNTAVAEKMVAHVLKALGDRRYRHIVDAYCGVGLFSAFLAPRCDQLTGIELSEAACNDFVTNLDEFDHVALYMGKVEQVLPALEIRPDLILLDPPRAGLDVRALEGLLKAQPQQVIYVSCDPATLARDLRKLLDDGYILQSVTPFDMFPQTYHVETISLLTKETH